MCVYSNQPSLDVKHGGDEGTDHKWGGEKQHIFIIINEEKLIWKQTAVHAVMYNLYVWRRRTIVHGTIALSSLVILFRLRTSAGQVASGPSNLVIPFVWRRTIIQWLPAACLFSLDGGGGLMYKGPLLSEVLLSSSDGGRVSIPLLSHHNEGMHMDSWTHLSFHMPGVLGYVFGHLPDQHVPDI